jgi:hypothetical protein
MRTRTLLAFLLAGAALLPEQYFRARIASAEFGGFSDTQGGFTEEFTDTTAREQDDIDSPAFLPATAVKFRFPSPYDTDGVRLTVSTGTSVASGGHGCGATDCVRQTGYSDWQNIFYEGPPSGAASDEVCFWNSFGDLGPYKGCYVLSTNTVTWAKLFEVGDDNEGANSATDSWQTSPTEANVLYIKGGGTTRRAHYLRCDTGSGLGSLPLSSEAGGDCTTVGDINTIAARTQMAAVLGGAAGDYLDDVRIWSPHVTADGSKFSATILDFAGNNLGAIFMTAADTWVVKPPGGDPFVDLSGTYGAMGIANNPANCPTSSGNDFIVFPLASPASEDLICDLHGGTPPGGAPGHLAFGFGYMLASDNDASAGGGAGFEQVKLWDLSDVAAGGVLVTSYPTNLPNGFGQPAWGTAVAAATTPIAEQMVFHTNVASGGSPNPPVARERELYVYRPGDPTVMVIAPQMTMMSAAGTGGNESEQAYYKGPKPNVSSDGRWYYLCSNHDSARMDCFLVRIPRSNLPMPGAPAPVVTLLDRAFAALRLRKPV